MGPVTVFCPLTMTGRGELVVQADAEARFVVDCIVKPLALVGQLSMTFPPEAMIASTAAVVSIVRTDTCSQ